MRKQRIFPPSLALLFVASLATAADQPQGSSIEVQELTELQKVATQQLGLSEAQFRQYQKVEQRAMERQAILKDAFGESFAGVHIRRNEDNSFTFVLSHKNGAKPIVKNGGMPDETKVVRYSLQELESFLDALVKTAKTFGEGRSMHTIGIDVPGNAVTVTTDIGGSNDALKLINASRTPREAVNIIESDNKPAPSILRGGEQYQVSGFGSCSVGFAANRDWDAAPGFISAGHCGTQNSAVNRTGVSNIGVVDWRMYGGADLLWAQITNTAWAPQPYTNNYSGGYLPVHGNREVPVGGAVCRVGITTGYQCGSVTATNVSVYYQNSNVYLNNLGQTNACVSRGDSGGSVISISGNEAQGVVSGGNRIGGPDPDTNCDQSYRATYYQRIELAIDWIPGIILSTIQTCGRLTSGYQIGGSTFYSRSNVDGCSNGYSLKVNPSNNWLTLYQYNNPSWPIVHVGSGGYLRMQTNGTLSAHNSSGGQVWTTGSGSAASEMTLSQHGDLIVLSADQQTIHSVYCPKTNWFNYCDDGTGP